MGIHCTILASYFTLDIFHSKMLGEGTRTEFFFKTYIDALPQLNKMMSLDD